MAQTEPFPGDVDESALVAAAGLDAERFAKPLDVFKAEDDPVDLQPVEPVERLGIGHPCFTGAR